MAESCEFTMQLKSIRNDKYLIDSDNVKGTYQVVATLTDRDNLAVDSGNGGVIVKGSLCYVQSDDTLYLYDGSSWNEFEVGGNSTFKATKGTDYTVLLYNDANNTYNKNMLTNFSQNFKDAIKAGNDIELYYDQSDSSTENLVIGLMQGIYRKQFGADTDSDGTTEYLYNRITTDSELSIGIATLVFMSDNVNNDPNIGIFLSTQIDKVDGNPITDPNDVLLTLNTLQIGNSKYTIPTMSDIYPKLDKTSYEWNKSLNISSSGYIQIGSFPMYDTNLTIEISSTDSSGTYYGMLLVSTQNTSTSSIGSVHKCEVHGDINNAITPKLIITWESGSRNYNIYFKPNAWSKNFIHARATGNYLNDTDESLIAKNVSTVPSASTSGLEPVNLLLNNYLQKTGGTMTGPLSWQDGTALPQKTLSYILGIDAFASGGETGWQSKSDFLSQSTLTSQLGLGSLDNSAGWGTTTASNGYTIRWGSHQDGGGGLIISEKGGQTFIQVDGQVYVNEGANKLIHTGEIDSYITTYFNNHTYNGSYS